MTKEEIEGYVETALELLALTMPAPIAAAIKLAQPELPALFVLVEQLRGGADPEELRRAIAPSRKEVYDELLGNVGPDGQPKALP